nr:N-acetylmuramoyl-L-alanine amidase [Desulfurispira natronophila]
MAGYIYEQHKNDILLAVRHYEQLIERFPESDAAVRALQRLDDLGDIARSPLALAAQQRSQTSPTVTRTALAQPDRDPGSSPKSAQLVNVDTFSNQDYTRAVMRFADANGDVTFKKHWLREDRSLNMPPRLFIDIFDAQLAGDMENIVLDNTHLQGVRMAQYDSDTVRVVFDINSVSDFKVFVLQNPVRVVVDLTSDPEPDPMAITRNLLQAAKKAPPEPVITAERPAAASPSPPSDSNLVNDPSKLPAEGGRLQLASLEPHSLSLAKQLGLGINTVVIDPGHGGRDPGAVGHRGLKEKDVVLDVSRRAAEYLRRNSDLNVLLTREKDEFLPLEARTAFANTHRADLFVSVHTNAFRDSSVHGIETYYLNITSDPRAMEVAARENSISQRNVSDLQNILNDLMMNSKISESSVMAQVIHNDLYQGVRRHHPETRNAGIKKAPFYVLIGAQMPSILVELGFITNPREGALMATENYRQMLAENMARGIIRYAENHD